MAFDDYSGQYSGPIGAGIDTDAIGSTIHPVRNGVTVDYDTSMVMFIGQERVAYPA